MNSPFRCLAFAAVVCITANTSNAQVNTQRGATVGGLAGAAIGAAIGDHNKEAGAGAAIGGVLGAVAGGILGNASDKEAAYQRQHQYYRAQQQEIVRVQSAVSMTDVISMCRSGLSDNVIINQVQTRGFTHKLTVQDIIALHQQGVSEHVITVLQHTPPGARQVATPQPVVVQQPVVERVYTPAPVIVREHVVPHYYRPSYSRGRSHHHRAAAPTRSGIHIRF